VWLLGYACGQTDRQIRSSQYSAPLPGRSNYYPRRQYRCVGRAISCVCDFVCMCLYVCSCVRAVKGKWFELSTPKVGRHIVHMAAGARHALTLTSHSKGQGHMHAAIKCAAGAVGLQVYKARIPRRRRRHRLLARILADTSDTRDRSYSCGKLTTHRHSRDDPREDVGVGVVECELKTGYVVMDRLLQSNSIQSIVQRLHT